MKIRIHRDRQWLLLAPNVLFALDIALTVIGQPSGVWDGSGTSPNEVNPVAAILLSVHPLVFVTAAVGYAVAFSIAILVLPRWLAVYCFLGLTLAHAYGASSWVSGALQLRGLPAVDQSALYAIVATLSLLGYLRAREKPQPDPQADRKDATA
jgi:hypothetical protein